MSSSVMSLAPFNRGRRVPWGAVGWSLAAHAVAVVAVLAATPRTRAIAGDATESAGVVDFAVAEGGGGGARGGDRGAHAGTRAASQTAGVERSTPSSRSARSAGASGSSTSASAHHGPLLSTNDALRLAMLAGEESADPARGGPATPAPTAPAQPAVQPGTGENTGAERTASAGEGTGSGTGSGNGDGGAPARVGISPEYAARLDGWFSAYVSLHGLELPWDELRHLSARVSITLTPDRQLTSFNVRGSGYAPYDERIESALRALVSRGATLPAPPEGEPVPPRLTLVFRCRSQERCS